VAEDDGDGQGVGVEVWGKRKVALGGDCVAFLKKGNGERCMV